MFICENHAQHVGHAEAGKGLHAVGCQSLWFNQIILHVSQSCQGGVKLSRTRKGGGGLSAEHFVLHTTYTFST